MNIKLLLLNIIFFSILMMGCQSQKNNVDLKNETSVENNSEYFIGNWKFVEQKYMDGAEEKNNLLHECMKKYTWFFEQEGQNFFLTKNYATGKDCATKSSLKKIPILIEASSISYTSLDLKRKEDFIIISKNRFSIHYTDILNGKVTQIIDIYERQ